jgi:hypothetical protein
VSSRTTVPPDIFSRDLQEPFVDLRTIEGVDDLLLDPPPKVEAPSTGANIMQIEGSIPPSNLKPDWCTSYLDCLVRGDLPPNKIEAQRITCRAKTFMIYGNDKELYQCSPTGILRCCITVEKVGIYSKIYTRGLVAITRHLEPSLKTCFDKASIGRSRSLTLSSWYAPAKDASTMQGRLISWLAPCKPSPSLGLLLFGGLTWSDP